MGSRSGEEVRVISEQEPDMRTSEEFKSKFTAVQEQELEQLLREFLTS